MNFVVKFGLWLENRKKVPLRLFTAEMEEFRKAISEVRKPSAEMKELVLLKARMDRLELYVGLRRDLTPQPVPGAARIS